MIYLKFLVKIVDTETTILTSMPELLCAFLCCLDVPVGLKSSLQQFNDANFHWIHPLAC